MRTIIEIMRKILSKLIHPAILIFGIIIVVLAFNGSIGKEINTFSQQLDEKANDHLKELTLKVTTSFALSKALNATISVHRTVNLIFLSVP